MERSSDSGDARQRISRDDAQELGREMQALAAVQATVDHDFCVLVDRFDASGALAHFDGVTTTAHFVAWACSMNATAAREHVRVARALREMPRAKELFRQGRLSYSKMRELTRLVGIVDEAELCDLALEMTASQLARTVSTFRLLSGTRIRALPERRYSSQVLENGMVRISVVLPAEEAALVDAAVEAAVRAAGAPVSATEPPVLTEGTFVEEPRPVARSDRVQALLDVAAGYLETRPAESADDHTVVVVHVNAEALDVPAGTSVRAGKVPAGTSGEAGSVPAGTLLETGTCYVEGHGAIEPETAQRLMCTAKVQGVLVGRGGRILDLGRAKRLASRAQRRALRVRDKGICQFPGCHSTTRLDAHHIVPWSHGGGTDLDNLILLCGGHHTLVHEGGLGIVEAHGAAHRRWNFHLPDGRRVDAEGYRSWKNVDDLTEVLARLSRQGAEDRPERIFPSHAGAGFSLHECIRVLFDITLDDRAAA